MASVAYAPRRSLGYRPLGRSTRVAGEYIGVARQRPNAAFARRDAGAAGEYVTPLAADVPCM